MADLKQTKGQAVFRGKIFGLLKEDMIAMNETGTMEKMNLRIKTSEDNSHFIGITYFPSTTTVGFWVKHPTEEKKGAYVKIPYDDRYSYDNQEELKQLILDDMENVNNLEEKNFADESGEVTLDEIDEKGINTLGIIVVKGKEEGEENTIAYPRDAMDLIVQKFEEGDDVVVIAEKTTSGKDKPFHSYEIKKILASNKPIDFNDPEFIEQSELKDNFIFNSILMKEKDKKALVSGYSIAYTGQPVLVEYVIDWNDFEEDKDTAEYLKKKAKYGDIINVDCLVFNKVTYKEQNESHVGRHTKSNKPKRVVDSRFEALQIIGINDIKKGYTKEELMPSEQ